MHAPDSLRFMSVREDIMRTGSGLGAVVVAALLVGGCAGSGEQNEPEMNRAGGEGLVESMEVKVTDSLVRFVLHVTNSGDEPLDLTFPTSQRYDFAVRTPAGEEVWRWSEGMSFLQAITEETLPPGESWTVEGEWDPGDREGQYVATGVLTARESGVRQEAAFRVGPDG